MTTRPWVLALVTPLAAPAAAPAGAQVSAPVLKWAHGGCFASWCETGWYASPAVADLDGDGSAEVLFTTWTEKGSNANGSHFVLSSTGALLHQVLFPAGLAATSWNGALAAPTLADLDGDPDLEVVLQTSGASDTSSGEIGLLGVYFSTRTYSAQRDGCGFGDFTLAHEMGHNWGMGHDPPRPSSAGTLLAPYARAFYLSAVDKNTAMGCANVTGVVAGTAAVCKRIAHFSDDIATYQGHATGNADRRNAQMARGRLGSYPFFKSQKTISPPVASFTRSCNSGTFYWVHLLATDNTNQRDLAIDSATF